MGDPWPLVGRREELELALAAMEGSDGAPGIVLAGAPGVGKTRLAREVVGRLRPGTVAVRWAVGTHAARKLPWGAFGGPVDVTPPALTNGTARGGAFGPARAVLAIDDAHLLDEASAAFVHGVVVGRRARVVVTLRTGEPAPDAITALWKDEHVDRLELQNLSESECVELVGRALGGRLDSGAGRRLWRLTLGNALFLRQLVQGELGSGRLREVDGVWRWESPPSLSASLTELVESRMGALPDDVRDVVDVLALCEPVEIPMLVGLTAKASVERAEEQQLVRVTVDGHDEARLAHPLYGEVRRERIGRVRRLRIEEGLVRALGQVTEPTEPQQMRRAVLALDAGVALDPDELLAAAQIALRAADYALAQQLAESAVHGGGGFAAGLALAFSYTWRGLGAEAEAIAAGLATEGATADERTQVAVFRAGNLFWSLGRPAEAQQVVASARVDLPDDGAQRALAGAQAAFDAWLGRTHAAVRHGTFALESDHLPAPAVCLAAFGLLSAWGSQGHVELMTPVYARAQRAVQEPLGASLFAMSVGHFQSVGLRLAGHLGEMGDVVRWHHAAGMDGAGVDPLRGVLLLATADLAQGRVRTALARAREAISGLQRQALAWDHLARLVVVPALALIGDAAGARRELAELESCWDPAMVFVEPELILARAWVLACEGAVTGGQARAIEAADVARSRGQSAWEVAALQTAVRFGAGGLADRLTEVADRVDGPRAPLAATHARALGAGDGRELIEVSADLERIGDLLAAADAAAQAALLPGADTAASMAASARAARLAALCEGARTPALLRALRPLPLTAREREIVELAVNGLTNREIADLLVVSVRTVEGHLYRAYGKLGTADRALVATMLVGA